MAEDQDQREERDRSTGERSGASSRSREKSNGSSRKESGSILPGPQAIGWIVVLLILAGYFIWMIVEMGAHAVTKAWPMIAVLVAALLGGIAATLGLAIGRRGRSD